MTILKSRLFLKIIFSYFIVLLVVLLAVDFFMAWRLHDNYVGQEKNRLESMVQILALNFPQATAPPALQAWVLESSQVQGVRITVIDSGGKVLAENQADRETMNDHSNRPEFQEAMQQGKGSSIRYSRTLQKMELYFAWRLYRPGRGALILRSAIPLQDISEGFRPTQRELALISIFPFLLALLLGYFFAHSLMRRVAEIRDFSANIAQGNLNARVKGGANDELKGLADSLNATADVMQRNVRELQEEKNRSQAILEGMHAGVMATNAEGYITLINPALSRILQLNPQEQVGKKVLEVVRNVELKGVLDRVLAEFKEVAATIEIVLTTKRTFAVVAVPLFHQNATLAGVVVVLHDISRIVELENIRKDFVANLSHELRTPLTSIRGFAETLLDGALEDKKNNRRFVEIIKNHAIRLCNLANDLLTLASLESESIRLRYDMLEWESLFAEIVEETKPIREQKNQSVTLSIRPELPAVKGDRERLRQVLANLLDNAFKFTPKGGQIALQVASSPDGQSVEVHVTDNGMGIPSQDLPRIFERFYRVDKARSRELGGTGLGLAIVRHLIEAHKGKVGVSSQLGKGSDFYFTLPV
jgi:two-component system phosphate regulon sensor histidine kinase PhoR